MKTPNLYILMGIPGCGKSTWAKTFFNSMSTKIISSDAIREELTGDINAQHSNANVFAEFHDRIRHWLNLGWDVVADSTALDGFARDELRDDAFRSNAPSHLIIFKNNTQAVGRNLNRDRVVPDDVMMRMLYKYERSMMGMSTEARHYHSVTVLEYVE